MNAPFFATSNSVTEVDFRQPDDVARIEGFVAEMGGSVFHRPAWLMAVERGTGQRARGLLAEKGGAIMGWLPLTEIHSPIFGRMLASSGFAVEGGVLAGSNVTVQKLIGAATEYASRLACTTIELRGGVAGHGWDVNVDGRAKFVAPLADDGAAQLLAIPRKQRAEVRRSLTFDLEVRIGRDAADRAAHYAVYAQSVHNLGTPVFPRSLFDAMLDALDSDILTVRHKGTPVASVLSLYHDGAVMPYWGGGTWDARRLRGNDRMYYALMLHAQQRGCDRFDFGRSKTGSGPYHFKKNWGFTPAALSYASWTAPGHAKHAADPTSEGNQRRIQLWKKLPLPIANRIGPVIARGLG